MQEQPQYFDVNGGASQPAPPFWRSPKFLAGIGFAVLAIFLAIFLVNFFTQTRNGLEDAAASTLARQLADCEQDKDVEACQDRVRRAMARESGSQEACKGLTSDEYASCAILAARQSGNMEACEGLEGDARGECEDLASLTLAREEGHIDACSAIANPAMATRCRLDILSEAAKTGECEEAGVPRSVCDSARDLAQAVAQGTAKACAALQDGAAQEECVEAIASQDEDNDGLVIEDEVAVGTTDTIADTDNDGLSDGDEVKTHKSDPTNADTDGDGYNDGDEVENGFSPVS